MQRSVTTCIFRSYEIALPALFLVTIMATPWRSAPRSERQSVRLSATKHAPPTAGHFTA